MEETPQYKVWIRLDRLWLFSSLALVSLVGVALSVFSPWFVLFVIPFGLFLYISVIVSLCAYRFSPIGGDFQRRIHELVASLVKKQQGGRIWQSARRWMRKRQPDRQDGSSVPGGEGLWSRLLGS